MRYVNTSSYKWITSSLCLKIPSFCYWRYWPPVREVCPNYEVVEFQLWTLTTPDLGFFAYCYSLIYPFCPSFFFSCFMDIFFPLFPTSYLSVAVPIWSPINFHPLPASSPGAKRCPNGRRLHPPPTSLRRSSLRPAPRACVCCRSFAGLLSPFPHLSCTQVLVVPWGVCPLRLPPRLYVPKLSSPSFPPNLGIVQFWCTCQVNFREKARGQGASTPWQLRALVLAPRYFSMPAPFRLPGSSPPPSPPPLVDIVKRFSSIA